MIPDRLIPPAAVLERIPDSVRPCGLPRGYFDALVTPTRELLDRGLSLANSADWWMAHGVLPPRHRRKFMDAMRARLSRLRQAGRMPHEKRRGENDAEEDAAYGHAESRRGGVRKTGAGDGGGRGREGGSVRSAGAGARAGAGGGAGVGHAITDSAAAVPVVWKASPYHNSVHAVGHGPRALCGSQAVPWVKAVSISRKCDRCTGVARRLGVEVVEE